MSITPSEELLNQVVQAQADGKDPNRWINNMMVRLQLEGCYSGYAPFTKTISIRFNGHVIAEGPDGSYKPWLEALKFIVARERLKGKNV